MSRIRVYTASCTQHASLWQTLVSDWLEVHFTARWALVHAPANVPESHAKVFWSQDLADVLASDVVLIYAEEGDQLRGALVEAGAALGAGRPVLAVGPDAAFGSWACHPLVHRLADLQGARALLRTMAVQQLAPHYDVCLSTR
jgi:nucleoside 2-deoxyribosyltransferase